MPNYLQDFDTYMEKILDDWNAPGIGVGIVENDALVFSKGYGYRDYERKLPVTASTLFPIGSNTKLFTAVAAGFLVNENLLTFDRPIRDSVPALRFYNEALNQTVTLHDMLAHRTGITRHDKIWHRSDFTRKELFERIQYLEPSEPIRQKFIYNNLMYAAAGYAMELQTGKTWEELVREKILRPLEMDSTGFTIAEMLTQPDFVVPYAQKRDSTEIYKIPYYEETAGVAPAGAIISNIEDMSHWLIALMNLGEFSGKRIIPPNILKATMEPAMAVPDELGETWGFFEQMLDVYGMGRVTASYRGHLIALHGGAIGGFHSQVSFLPRHRIGVIAFAIGDHCSVLPNSISYNVYENFLGLDRTPWSERWLEITRKSRETAKEARAKAGADRVSGTAPSHPLADYVGDYEHRAYGVLTIAFEDERLTFNFRKASLPLSHFHYDRFDTQDAERHGKFSVNFGVDPQGDVDRAVMSLDEAEVIFTRRADRPGDEVLEQLSGTYESPVGYKFQIILKERGALYLALAGQPEQALIFYKGLRFRAANFSDRLFEFVRDSGRIAALKYITPAGEDVFARK